MPDLEALAQLNPKPEPPLGPLKPVTGVRPSFCAHKQMRLNQQSKEEANVDRSVFGWQQGTGGGKAPRAAADRIDSQIFGG